jgi:AraC-like DNA-binding protein
MVATVLISHPCFLVAAGLTSMLAEVPGWQVRAQPASSSMASDVQVWHGIDAIVADAGWRMPACEPSSPAAPGLVVTTPQRACQPDSDARLPLYCDGRELIEAVARAINDADADATALRRHSPGAACRGGLAPTALRRVLAYVDAHLGSRIELRELADQAGISLCHFSRAFRQSVGESPHRHLVKRRIDRAMAALRDTDQALGDIGADVGFSDQSHFTRVFHAVAGETPYAFRRRHR